MSAALVSGGVVLSTGAPLSVAQPGVPSSAVHSATDPESFEPVTEAIRSEIVGRIAGRAAAEILAFASMPEQRARALEEAVGATLESLLGDPDRMIAYQQEHGATLDTEQLRTWVDQLHEWQMLESVSAGEPDDELLYAQSVRHAGERFAAFRSVSVADAAFAVDLTAEAGVPERSDSIQVWKLSTWDPSAGTLTQAQGDAIQDGTTGRTASVSIPAMTDHVGECLIRIEFFWDTESAYWVPHMVLMGIDANTGGKALPMLLF
ncbi:MAG: hypothetical protein Q9O74_08055 [Planctomycetota bacterium]|nr:hypothetical protein [Planctomycetota bacterium]